MRERTQEEGRRTLVGAVLVAAAGLSVFSALNSFQVSSQNSKQYADPYGVAAALTRFAPLREKAGPDAELGYFTDIPAAAPNYTAAFLSAQYAAAPRLLRVIPPGAARTQPPEWAVGNFSRPQDYGSAGEPLGYRMVEDLGNGVVLFRRTGAR
jgi:hypothetical protein